MAHTKKDKIIGALSYKMRDDEIKEYQYLYKDYKKAQADSMYQNNKVQIDFLVDDLIVILNQRSKIIVIMIALILLGSLLQILLIAFILFIPVFMWFLVNNHNVKKVQKKIRPLMEENVALKKLLH